MKRDADEETAGLDRDDAGSERDSTAALGEFGGVTLPPDLSDVDTLPPGLGDVDTLPPLDPGDEADTTPEPGDLGLSSPSRATRRTAERTTRSPRSGRDAARSAGPPRLPRVGDRVHHYEIIRELGRGGMGVVCLARDLRLARRVAIKFVLTEGTAHKQRFLTEARTTARCHHENIVIIHDIDEHGGNPFMVLEYMAGRSLRDLLDGQPMSSQRVIELMIPVARALERAHDFGIVHRDLKPANIFVTDAGIVKVLDFGIAKLRAPDQTGGDPGHEDSAAAIPLAQLAADASMTRTGALVGTVPYMSPEQISGHVDHRTDLWAMGLILYEMVAGKHPLSPLNPGKLNSLVDLTRPMLDEHNAVPPAAGKLGLLIERCLIKPREDRLASARELREALEALAPSHSRLILAEDESPYAGLAAFQKSQADRFFGRDQEIANVVAQLHSRPLVTLVGPSGAGKSSLVRAGVIPALERSGEGWRSMVIRPGTAPLGAVANLLASLSDLRSTATTSPGDATPSSRRSSPSTTSGSVLSGVVSGVMGAGADDLAARLHDEPGYLGQVLRDWARRKKRRVVLLIDQFEELYTLGAHADERTAFVKCLEGAADDASSPLRVVLSIRSDFLDRVVEDSTFMTQVTRGLVLLPPMGRDGLREALTKPIEATGYHFEDVDLVDTMLDALETTPGALPLLQFTATKLWETRERQRRVLTRQSYDDLGGVAGTLATHADAVLAGMSSGKRPLVRAVFQRLVTPERTRAIATLDDLAELPGDRDTIEQVINHLADARLLAIETRSDGTSSVEIIHESLIASWPTLRHWLDEDQDDAEFLARLRAAATDWDRSGRAEGALWRGEPMRAARHWHDRYRGELPRREAQYLDAVFSLASRTTRRRRLAVSASMAVLVLLLIAATVALLRIQKAEQVARQRAVEAQEKSLALDRSLQSETEQKRAAQQATLQADQAAREALRANERLRDAIEQTARARDKARASEADARASEARARQAAQRARLAEAEARAKQQLAEQRRREAEEQRRKAEAESLARQRLIDRAVGPVKNDIR